MSQKTIGILGGMGPAATVELFNRIVNNTSANVDSEHVNMIIINDPQIPDRTDHILGKGMSPVPKLLNNLNKLYYAGADIAVIPCMTAHSYLSELHEKSPIPIVNAIEIIDDYINSMYPRIMNVGLLATTGSITSGVFQKYVSKTIYTPKDNEQAKLMDLIYGNDGIKSGNTSAEQVNKLNGILKNIKSFNVQAVIAGCTELSLIIDEKNALLTLPIIDPIVILANYIIDIASNYSLKDHVNN